MLNEKFTSELIDEIKPIMKRIYCHPFTIELAGGTLSRECFCFYMQQDSLYLIHFSRALALTGSRFTDESRIARLLEAAQGALLAERGLHEHYFKEFGVSRSETENPACLGYSSFMLATSALGSLGEAAAALYPCFWIYREVGNRIASTSNLLNNPYKDWIKMYSDKKFSDGVDRYTDLVDEIAADASRSDLAKMKKCFITASQYEYHFWDCAYRLEHMDSFLKY